MSARDFSLGDGSRWDLFSLVLMHPAIESAQNGLIHVMGNPPGLTPSVRPRWGIGRYEGRAHGLTNNSSAVADFLSCVEAMLAGDATLRVFWLLSAGSKKGFRETGLALAAGGGSSNGE